MIGFEGEKKRSPGHRFASKGKSEARQTENSRDCFQRNMKNNRGEKGTSPGKKNRDDVPIELTLSGAASHRPELSRLGARGTGLIIRHFRTRTKTMEKMILTAGVSLVTREKIGSSKVRNLRPLEAQTKHCKGPSAPDGPGNMRREK